MKKMIIMNKKQHWEEFVSLMGNPKPLKYFRRTVDMVS